MEFELSFNKKKPSFVLLSYSLPVDVWTLQIAFSRCGSSCFSALCILGKLASGSGDLDSGSIPVALTGGVPLTERHVGSGCLSFCDDGGC